MFSAPDVDGMADAQFTFDAIRERTGFGACHSVGNS
jgi:hypothetical protein